MKVLKVNAANEHGDTPLHLASRWGYGKLYSEASCYRGHMLRYPDGDVVSETITKFSFTLDFRIILTTTPPHVKNGQRQTQSVKCRRKKWSRGRLCLLLFALSVHSIFVSGNKAFSRFVDRGSRTENQLSARWQVDETISQMGSKLVTQSAGSQTVDRSVS